MCVQLFRFQTKLLSNNKNIQKCVSVQLFRFNPKLLPNNKDLPEIQLLKPYGHTRFMIV